MSTKSLQGKVAIVTGGTRGIGRGIAIELARRGASVLITYNSASSTALAEQFVAEVEKLGGRAAAVRADCKSQESPKSVVDAAVKSFDGGIDIIVNNAGVSEEYWLNDITYEHFDNVMQPNVRFPIFLVKESLPYLRKGGRIVNLSSVCAREGWKMHTVYGASKASLESIARTWAVELGQKYGVTVNCVNPGPVQTEMWDAMPAETSGQYDGYIQSTPAAPRVADIDDVVQVVGFLCEEGSRWVTGSTICANGGAVMV